MGNKLLILFSGFVFFSVIGYTSYTYFTPQSLDVYLVTAPSGTVSLSLETPPNPLIINTEYTLNLKYSSPTQHFTAISATLTYDPTLVSLSNFVPSASFPSIFQPAKIETGKLSFALGVKPEANGGLMGSGTIASFKIKPLKTGVITLAFADPTIATVTESSSNALQGATTANLTVKNPPLAGDLFADDKVDILDFNYLLSKFGNPYTILDFNAIVANFGKTR